MHANQNKARRPPSPIHRTTSEHAPLQSHHQQKQHHAHHQKSNGPSVAHAKLDRKVVGMAVPLPLSVDRIQNAEGRGTPSKPGSLTDQLQAESPLCQAGEAVRGLSFQETLTQAAWQQSLGPLLNR
tara:strand:+ start:884 stop:1261 length:378 start_codon:yes stop_codon:yes gene_type:complete